MSAAAGATLAASTASAQDAPVAAPDAVAALHRAVFELPIENPFPDAGAARELGLRYVEGRGVERDAVMGCAGMQLAYVAARHAHEPAAVAEAEALVQRHCNGLSPVEKDEALEQMGCPAFGLKRQTFNLEAGAWLEVGRNNIAIDRSGGRTEHPLAGNLTCNHQFVLVKQTTVDPPPGATVQPRHFVQFLSWTAGHGAKGLMRSLHWVLLEASAKIEYHVVDFLALEPGSAWPTPPVPEIYRDGAVLTMARDGSVRWHFAAEPARAGTIDRQ